MIVASGRVRAYPGEKLSGDAVFIEETAQGMLLAVVDALGHGPTPASVAELALETLAACRRERPVRISAPASIPSRRATRCYCRA